MRAQTRKKTSDHYLELVQQFPLRPLRSEKDLNEALLHMDALVDKDSLDADEADYFEVLSALIERYELEHHSIAGATDAELLRHLIEAKGTNQVSVSRACAIAESTVSEVLAGKRGLNRAHIGKLAKFFNVSPSVFAFEK